MHGESGTEGTGAEGRRALLAVDDPALSLFLETLLEREGFAVTAARCDGSTLPLIAAGGFTLAVIDATQAAAEGLQAACGAALPVLALCAGAGSLPGAAAELRLPTDAVGLRAAILRCLAEPPAIDTDLVTTLWGGVDNPVYHRIVRVFLEDLRQRLANLEAAIKAGAQDAVEREAHSIKGAAATVGAAAIATIAAALETAAERGEARALSVMFARLRQVSAAGIAWLESLLAGDVSS